MIGSHVELHSLTSAAGQQLNGQQGTIAQYDAAAERFEVVLSASSRRLRVRPMNVRRRREPEGGGGGAEAAGGGGSSSNGSSETYTHFGRGCDGCGVFPIVGRCYRCEDCSEAIGYDLCGRCFDLGFHKREPPAGAGGGSGEGEARGPGGGGGGGGGGRFNQAHRPEHQLVEVEQEETFLHTLQRQHPELTVDQIIALLQQQR